MASNLRVDSIVPATGGSVSIGTATGGVSIPGVLTYEDVTNVDSIGVITARSGIDAASNLLLKTGGNERLRITSNGDFGLNDTSPTAHASGNNTVLSIKGKGSSYSGKIDFKDSDGNIDSYINSDNSILQFYADPNSQNGNTLMRFFVHGGERVRIASAGQIGLGGANYGTSGQVLTSQGASSAAQWATPSSITTAGGTMTIGFQDHVSGNTSSTTPTAYYQRIGNMVFCSVDTGAINLSGLNNGEILLVTGCFPVTRDNNWDMCGSAYQYTINTAQNGGGPVIVPTMGYWLSNTSLYFVIPRNNSTADNLTVGMCNSNNTRIFMQWSYKVN